jgi:DNA processing protein
VSQLSAAELEALLRLRCVPQLGHRRLRMLVAEHGSAEAVLRLPPAVLGVHGNERDSLRTAARVARALLVIEELRVHVLACMSPGYPRVLEQLHQPPILLFLRGRAELLASGGVAVVGTRRPADYGAGAAALLAGGIARAGVTVWSGMARGVDAIAHAAALDAGGGTVAVLGCGIDVVYPREHEPLAERIATDGLLMCEYLPGEPPLAHHFPERNRIIACLAAGVVVVEAREDGGALITAEQASELGRAVMAVPGPIGRVTSYGPNRLIQDGAKLVMEVADVLEELGLGLNAGAARERPSAKRHWTARRPQPSRADARSDGPAGESITKDDRNQVGSRAPLPVVAPRYRAVWQALDTTARHIDEIATTCAQPVARILPLLLELELDGRVGHMGGNRYRRCS